jgi:very-short-patch-repair endonuclease
MRERSRQLRNNPTSPELRLWQELRGSRLGAHKFRRQARIGTGRIADFFCPAKGLIVEVDGDTHDRASDLKRDAAIERRFGYRTIRVTNQDVMRNLDGVIW